MTKLLTTLILTYYTTGQKINNDTEKTVFFISILNFSVLNLFCRWVADQTVAERLIDIWPNIKKVDDFWQNCLSPSSLSQKAMLIYMMQLLICLHQQS